MTKNNGGDTVIGDNDKNIDVVFPLRDLVREALEGALAIARDGSVVDRDQQLDSTVLYAGVSTAPLVREVGRLVHEEVNRRVTCALVSTYRIVADQPSMRKALNQVRTEYGRDGLERVLQCALDDIDGGIEWADVESTNVRRVGYSDANRVLCVEFKHGGEYRFADVPRIVFDELKIDGSPGGYFHRYVKGRYQPVEAAS